MSCSIKDFTEVQPTPSPRPGALTPSPTVWNNMGGTLSSSGRTFANKWEFCRKANAASRIRWVGAGGRLRKRVDSSLYSKSRLRGIGLTSRPSGRPSIPRRITNLAETHLAQPGFQASCFTRTKTTLGAPVPLRARSQSTGVWPGVFQFADFPMPSLKLTQGGFEDHRICPLWAGSATWPQAKQANCALLQQLATVPCAT